MGAIDLITGKPIAELSPLELLAHLRSLPPVSQYPNTDAAAGITDPLNRPAIPANDNANYGDWWGPTRRYEGGPEKRDPVPEELEWHDVSSSNVRRIAYEPDFHRLWIEFHSGALYRYFDFELSRWEDFLNSDSKGMFVWYIVRNNGTDSGTYGYEQVRAGMSTAQKRRPWF